MSSKLVCYTCSSVISNGYKTSDGRDICKDCNFAMGKLYKVQINPNENDFSDVLSPTEPLFNVDPFDGYGDGSDLKINEEGPGAKYVDDAGMVISGERLRLLESLYDEVRRLRENMADAHPLHRYYSVYETELMDVFFFLDLLENL